MKTIYKGNQCGAWCPDCTMNRACIIQSEDDTFVYINSTCGHLINKAVPKTELINPDDLKINIDT